MGRNYLLSETWESLSILDLQRFLFLVVNIRLQKVKVKDEILSDYEEPSSPGFNHTGPLAPPSPSNDDPDYNMDDDDANDDDEYVPGSEYSIQFC